MQVGDLSLKAASAHMALVDLDKFGLQSRWPHCCSLAKLCLFATSQSDSPSDSKEIKPVNPKRNQPWIFIGRIEAEAEAPILWPPDGKSQLIEQDADSGKDWRQEEKGETKDKMVGCTWAWANRGRQWRTGKPGVPQSMGLQRARLSLNESTRVRRKWWPRAHCDPGNLTENPLPYQPGFKRLYPERKINQK